MTTLERDRRFRECRVGPTDGFILRYLNRRISGWITFCLIRTPIRPTHVTAVVLFVTGTSAWLVSRGDSFNVAVGGVLFQLAAILDCCDGEIARIKQQESRVGAWLDTVVDRLGFVAFLAAAFWALLRQGRDILLLGQISLAVLCVGTGLGWLASSLWKSRSSPDEVAKYRRLSHFLRAQGGVFRPVMLLAVFVTRREALSLLFMAFALTNSLEALLTLVAAGGSVAVLVLSGLVVHLIPRGAGPRWEVVSP